MYLKNNRRLAILRKQAATTSRVLETVFHKTPVYRKIIILVDQFWASMAVLLCEA